MSLLPVCAHLAAALVGFWGAEVMLPGTLVSPWYPVCQGSEYLISCPHLRCSMLGGQVARGTSDSRPGLSHTH